MSFVEDAVRDVGDFFQEEVIDPLTGKDVERAIREGQAAQEAAGQRAITVGEQAQMRLEAGLDPFEQALGLDLLPQVQQLFGPGADITQDPASQAILNEVQRRVQAQQSAAGRPADETGQLLQENLLRVGSDILGRQRQDLLSALQFGQSSAAQSGVSGVQSAASQGDLLTQIANAQAAGALGGATARGQGLSNIIGGVGAISGGGGLGKILGGLF